MAIRIIRKNEDPVLREVSIPVQNINKNVHKLLDDMADTMYDADGVGLAAPQIGILKRVVIIDIGDGIIELINPEVIDASGEMPGPEGCLSFPGLTGEVCRSEFVKVKALDRNGEEFTVEGTGLLARALQHEIDHLNGVVFLDIAENIYENKR
ncbi:peptide deformylase [Desulfuribacillus stibiiarsenatis]|uniref:Peptide deformylase n=1 Tax=Desulfuribacillus stibiiarsenatis TaxID=1390249 RepID=A0A1E5L6K0_9FIRM|nr:peptide deformylase [Desulfuribacillus stibiiarsenatis]OEH85751.1 peptide deformylase [Desulfuribacillus stibiiarsenatis]